MPLSPVNNTKRLLIIAYNFPPLISPQSLRWLYLCRELVKMGFNVDVLTISMPPAFSDLTDMIPSGVRVYRTWPGPFYYLTFRYSRERSATSADKNTGGRAHKNISTIWRYLYKIYLTCHSAYKTFMIPDIYTEWLPFAICKGRSLLRQNDYDLIISSSEPRVCHIVAHLLKKKSAVKWIADYGDPWVYPLPAQSESSWRNSLIEWIEGSILKNMDAITVAAEGIKALYLKKYPFLSGDAIHTVTQGFSPELFEDAKKEGDDNREFRLVYCGSFYKQLRDPTNLFDALRELNIPDLKVIIAGRINEYAACLDKDELRMKVQYKGFVDHKQSIAFEADCSVLIFISNALDTQMPGKIYEYLGARRPILCISDNPDDLSARLIRGHKRGIVVGNQKDEIKASINKLFTLWQTGDLEGHFNLKPMNEYTWESSAKKIREVIECL